ncbi:nitroreductase [Actinomadura barringtoniae]|uniref:Putative NAD(P)H nitroreductase n=1 Tax=Actinomadura barringtoniae TaxID=1427535 RepID=A0A939T5K6_9ACTN|nr:nitroreductase [Actinomadura barringtoniae]MBO2447217.1 nitroreductase [Actinomadura barringtoniae]
MMDVLEAIHRRRSHPVLVEPAPAPLEIAEMIAAACAAPDHGLRVPWRFVTLEGAGKDAFRDVLEKAHRLRAGGSDPARERARLDRAPLVIVTVCVAGESDPVPRQERLAATSAATQNLLLAATALGYGSIWRTGWPARDVEVKQALGFGEGDDIVGFVYLGTASESGLSAPKRVHRDDLSWSWPSRD